MNEESVEETSGHDLESTRFSEYRGTLLLSSIMSEKWQRNRKYGSGFSTKVSDNNEGTGLAQVIPMASYSAMKR